MITKRRVVASFFVGLLFAAASYWVTAAQAQRPPVAETMKTVLEQNREKVVKLRLAGAAEEVTARVVTVSAEIAQVVLTATSSAGSTAKEIPAYVRIAAIDLVTLPHAAATSPKP